MKELIGTRVEHDKEADAIYIYLSDNKYAYGKDIDNERRIDYDANDKPIGVELLCVSEGVILEDLPYSSEIGKILIDKHIKVYA